MDIYINIDDYLFELFKEEKRDVNKIIQKLEQFYTLNGIAPKISRDKEVIKISVDEDKINKEHSQYQKLIQLCENREFQKAKELGLQLTKNAPSISEYHRVLGQIYSELGNQDEAINSLIDALRWDPKNEYALIMMGNIYARFYDDVETAMLYYDQVVKINPKDNIALNNIAANLLRQGSFDEAEHYFEKALSIDSTYPNTYVGLGMLYKEKNQLTKAFEFFIQGLKIYQKDDDLRKHLLGNAYGVSEEVMNSEDPEILRGAYKQQLEKNGNRIIEIKEDSTIPTAAKIEFAENYERNEDVVKYNPKFPGYHHLIMHELVHLELVLEARGKEENQLFITNAHHENEFTNKLSKYSKKLSNKGLPETSIKKVIKDLFNGLNNQIFNAGPDLFIEDRLYRNFPSLKPIQFVSMYNLIKEGIKAVTQKEIVDLADPWVLSRSRILNLINAIQFKDLFGVDLIKEFKAPQKEIIQAKKFYDEFLEYKDDKLPAEEYELINHWAEDLELNAYFDLVSEIEFREKDKSESDFNIDAFLEGIENDPFDLESDDSLKDKEMYKFLKTQEELGINIAVAMFMVEALDYFTAMDKAKVKEIAFEIAMQGRQGYNPEEKYKLNKIPNKTFSGYQILAFYYVSWALAIPEMLSDLQLPFDHEYELAKKLKK